MGAIVIRTRYDEGMESAEVATSDRLTIRVIFNDVDVLLINRKAT